MRITGWALRVTVVLAISVLVARVGTSETLAQMRIETSKPKQVDPQVDNSWALKFLVPTLVITLDIRESEVLLTQAQVVMAPEPRRRRPEREALIVVTGMRDGLKVSSVQVPDERVNVQENKGLVIMKNRTITAMLPLSKKIDTLEVRPPGTDNSISLDVHETIDDFCRTYRPMPLCKPDTQ